MVDMLQTFCARREGRALRGVDSRPTTTIAVFWNNRVSRSHLREVVSWPAAYTPLGAETRVYMVHLQHDAHVECLVVVWCVEELESVVGRESE